MSLFAIDTVKDITVENETFTIKKLSLGDQVEIAKKVRLDEVEASVLILQSSLKSWTLKTEAGASMPITRDNVLKLRMDLINAVVQQIYEFNNLKSEQIKNL